MISRIFVILSKSSYFIRSFKSNQVIMFTMFYQVNLVSFSCLHLCLTVLCTTPGLNAELLGRVLTTQKSTLLTLVWVQLPIWKCAISCHLICLPFDSSVISSHVLLFCHYGHMLMLVSPVLNVTFIKNVACASAKNQAVSRHTRPVQQNPNHFLRLMCASL